MIGRLGQSEDEREVTVKAVISGEAYTNLRKLQTAQTENNAKIGAVKLKIDASPDSPEKTQAYALWQETKAKNDEMYNALRSAIEQYNTIARTVRTVSLNTLQPKMLAGLGVVPVIAVVAAVVFAVGFAIDAYANYVRAANNSNAAVKSGLENIVDLLRVPGRTVEDIGSGFEKFFTGFSKVAWFVALGAAGYVGYKIYKKREGKSSSSITALAPAMPELKTVEGSVL